MTHRGPFQPLPFCDSVIPLLSLCALGLGPEQAELGPCPPLGASVRVRMPPAPAKPALAPRGCEIETDSSPELICAPGNINPAKTETRV